MLKLNMPKIVKSLFFLFSIIFPVIIAFADNTFVEDSNSFLSVDEAFKIEDTKLIDDKNLIITMDIAKGYYLYKSKIEIINKTQIDYLISYPEGKFKNDEYFGEQEVFYDSLRLKVNFKRGLNLTESINLKFQGCSEKGLCYPPTVRALELNKVLGQDQSKFLQSNAISKELQKDNLIIILIGFFVSGLLLSITPCVLPMVPVLSGIIMASNRKASRSLTISYVLGICFTYSALGILAGLTGNLLSSSIQNIGFLYFSGILFLLFGLAMLDIISIRIPLNANTMISQLLSRFSGGDKVSVFIMGLFSALILSPCVAPPLAAAIVYIGQTGDLLLGGISLLFMAIGMSTPLLILGFSSKIILPKPGIWMEFAKKMMGFILIAMAIYIIRPLLSELIFLVLLLIILTTALIFSLKQKDIFFNKNKKTSLLVLLFYIFAGSFLIQNIITQYSSKDNLSQLTFIEVDSKEALNKQLKLSTQKYQMLDFYADWCVACLEYEKYTFKDEKVHYLLSEFNLLKADVTENNIQHKDLMKLFNLFGPPGIVFFDKNGEHLKKFDVIGYKNAEEFYDILEEILNYDD